MTDNKMLHMKLNSAVCFAALLAFLPASACMFVSPAQAGICFLPDCNLGLPEFDNVNSDTKWCEDNGYHFTCPDGTAPDYSQTCSRDETYAKCTEEQYCKNKGYTKTYDYCRELGPTWYPDETKQCPNGQELYKECKEDTGRACEEDNKFITCTVGRPSKNDSEICEWNNNYSECCTDTPSLNCPADSKVEGCDDGKVTGKDSCGYECRQCCVQTCPAGYAYTDEQTSGGTTGYIKDGADYCNHCTKGKLYKRKENPCTGYDVCSAYGGVDNGDYCYTESLKKYSKCLTECRTGLVEWCDTPVTDCATLGYKYEKSACSGQMTAVCPFNTEKAFCENPCSYTITTSTCSSQCKSPAGKSCTRGGVTYYEGCNNFWCDSGEICSSGHCQIPTSGWCCYDFGSYCGDYEYCRTRTTLPDCSSMISSCESSRGNPLFKGCAISPPAARYECQ